MVKNRTIQLMYQTSFCTLGLIGILASFGLFDYNFNNEFYVYFTNISNYLCIFIMFKELIDTYKKKSDSYVNTLPLLKFIGLLGILLTFIVFNLLLANKREMYLNFTINSILLHVVLPIMYLIDWILFYKKGELKWYFPLVSALFPIIYVAFIYVRAWILKFNINIETLYPYFFLNLNDLGVVGVIKWIMIIAIGFIGIGYVIYGIDRVLKKR